MKQNRLEILESNRLIYSVMTGTDREKPHYFEGHTVASGVQLVT